MPLLNVRDAELTCDDVGTGPAVVMLHGTLMDRTMFAPQVAALSDRQRVVSYDHRGRSATGSRAPFSLDDLAEDLLGVLDALQIDRAVLCGMSMGGFTIQRFAVKYPQRVAGLIFIDTTAAAHPVEAVAQLDGMLGYAQHHGLAPLADPAADLLFGATTRREQPALVKSWQDRWLTFDIAAVANEVRSWLHREDFTPRLFSVAHIPALVIHGTEDVSLPPAHGRALSREFTHHQYVEIERAGHTSNVEQPAAVNQAILHFLATYFR